MTGSADREHPLEAPRTQHNLWEEVEQNWCYLGVFCVTRHQKVALSVFEIPECYQLNRAVERETVVHIREAYNWAEHIP
jgi:hypothetical protein